jgi:hypothetical protein
LVQAARAFSFQSFEPVSFRWSNDACVVAVFIEETRKWLLRVVVCLSPLKDCVTVEVLGVSMMVLVALECHFSCACRIQFHSVIHDERCRR